MIARNCGVLAVLVGLALPVAGQATVERPSRTLGSLINVDALIDNYLQFLTRKYDLTEDQAAYTEQLVRSRVDEFLSRHHDQVSSLIERLFEVRSGGDISPQELIEWGRRVQPLYNEAKAIIIAANDEWRSILSEQQRRIHDEDLRLMYESFSITEDQIQRLVSGQMTVEEFRNPRRYRQSRQAVTPLDAPVTNAAPVAAAARAEPAPAPAAGPTARQPSNAPDQSKPSATISPPSGAPGQVRRTAVPPAATPSAPAPVGRRAAPAASPAAAGKDFESAWEQYVRQFIERYRLDAEQQDRAYRILRACQQQAARYMRSKAATLEKLDKDLQQLGTSKEKDKLQRLSEISNQRNKLLAPINDIFEHQLKPRLEKIPTRAQRQAAEKGGKAPTPPTPGRPAPAGAAPAPVQPPPPPAPPEPQPGIEPAPEPVEPTDNPVGPTGEKPAQPDERKE
jgi:hypothetical protein